MQSARNPVSQEGVNFIDSAKQPEATPVANATSGLQKLDKDKYSVPSSERLRSAVIIAFGVLAFVVLRFFVVAVHSLIFRTYHDPAKQAETYITFLTTLVASTIGAAISAIIAYQFVRIQSQDKARKDALTYTSELYDKFSAMYLDRTSADAFLLRHPKDNLHDLYKIHGIKTQAIWRIIDFYCSLHSR